MGLNKSAATARRAKPWQKQALDYYDTLGPIWYAGQFYSRAFSKLRLFPAFLDENGEPQETEDPKAREVLDRVQDPGGGRAKLLGTYGRLRFLIGEANLTCSFTGDPLEEVWEILSPEEIRPTDDGRAYQRFTEPGASPIELRDFGDDAPTKDSVRVYRLWRRHPRYSGWADSPMRAVLEDCEELATFTKTVRSRATSRLAGPGVLLIPDELSDVPLEAVGDEDAQEDPLLADLIEAMEAAIADPESPAAQVPITFRGAADYLDKVRLISFRDNREMFPEDVMRDAAIRRIAISLDFSPEVLTGLGDVNHWSGWVIDESSFKSHIQPVAQELVDDLTSAYFREACREAGVSNWERAVVGYDPAEVINHPDRSKDAKDLHDRLTISDATLRDAGGFDDTDAPDEDELNRRIAIKLGDVPVAVTGNATDGAEVPAEVDAGPPPEPVVASVAVSPHDRVLVAAELAVERARELAGSRLRTKANNLCPPCKELLVDVPQRLVAATLGQERSAEVLSAGDERALVAGAFDGFVATLQRWGWDTNRAMMVAELVEQHAARTLWDDEPGPLPSGFGGYVKRAGQKVPVAA